MSKDRNRSLAAQDWVEVAAEPDHGEIFRNEQIRVYIAVIRPGRETLYHRHDKDTLYVVLQGGRNYSTPMPGSAGGTYVFPKSISLARKIKWLFTRSIFGWTYLPKSVYLLMHNDGSPIIHKVRGSEANPSEMRMLGIEFLQPGGRNRSVSVGARPPPVDYEDDTVRVHRLKVPSDLKHLKGPVSFTGLVIALKGALGIEASSPGKADTVAHDLPEGDFLWNDGGMRFTFRTPGPSASEALLVLMK